MKTKGIHLFASIVFICLFSTNLLADEVKTENRPVGEFNSISISIGAKIEFYQGNKTEVILHGEEHVLDDIVTKVRNNKLVIKYNKPFSFSKSAKEIKIKISTPEIEEISISGSADLLAKTDIKTKNMELNITGSGEIHIGNLLSDEIDAEISGSGAIKLAGSKSTKNLDVEITGSGDFESRNLKVNYASIDISGSGSCKIYASEKIKANITGSGDAEYKGNALIDASISGSGKIRSID